MKPALGIIVALTASQWWPMRTATANPPITYDEPTRTQARDHFRKGEAYYEAGQFAEAIAEYRVAYALIPSPAFVFDIAKAYQRKGERSSAIDYYRRYLDSEPQGTGSDNAREQLALLSAEIDAEERSKVVAAPVTSTPSIGVAPDPSPSTWLEPTLIGSGVVVGLIGGSLVWWSHRDFNELNRTCAPNCGSDQIDGPKTREGVGFALIAVGSVAAATGAVLWVRKPTARDHRQAWISPTTHGVAIGGRF